MVYRRGDRPIFIADPANHAWELFFGSVQEEDEGEYFCVATNQHSIPKSRTSAAAVMSVGGTYIDWYKRNTPEIVDKSIY